MRAPSGWASLLRACWPVGTLAAPLWRMALILVERRAKRDADRKGYAKTVANRVEK